MPAPTTSTQDAREAYQQAVNELYMAPSEVTDTVERSAGQIYTEQLEERSATVAICSEALRETLIARLTTEDLDQRELATLKLLAAAAYDVSVAGDLLELQDVGLAGEPERTARGAILAAADLRDILDAPLEGGISGLLEVERAVLPDEPKAARAYLEKTIAAFVDAIPKDAAHMGQATVSGVVNLGFGPAQGALSLATQEILARLPEGASIVVRRAAQLVVEAIRKLRAAIGEELEEHVRKQATTWLDDIQNKRDTVTGLLDKLYETRRIGEDVATKLAKAGDNVAAEQYNQATRALEELIARYAKTRGVLDWVMRILSVVKTPLMGAAPWGPIAVYATYLGALTYAICSGGDYLDWYRLEQSWLDRVEGLRTTVGKAVGSAENTSTNSSPM